MLTFPILLLFLRVSANPVPSSSTDLVTDGDSSSVDSDNLANAGCPGDTASTQILDEGNEGDLDIFRRNTKTFCPMTAGYSWEWGKSRPVQWKAPPSLPQIAPEDHGDYGGENHKYCPHLELQYQVTCGGPEVWYGMQIGYVLNCEVGFHASIPARRPWPEATVVSIFCCHKGLGEKPLFAAYMCDRIGRTVLKIWSSSNLNAWIDSGYDPASLNKLSAFH